MNRHLGIGVFVLLALGLRPQQAHAKEGKSKVDQRWSFQAGLNFNLPTGKLNYAATFNPVFDPTATMVNGGFTLITGISYAFRAGYDRAISRNGMHGFTFGLGMTDRKEVWDFHDYFFTYHGFEYRQQIDRYIFDDLDIELTTAYRFRKDRTTIQLGAIGLVRSQRVMHELDLDGSHFRTSNSSWWKLKRWYPLLEVDYLVLIKGNCQFEAFTSADRRGWGDGEVSWWDIQVGVKASFIRQRLKRK